MWKSNSIETGKTERKGSGVKDMEQGKNSFDLNSEVKNTPHIVKVDGVQLFSADWVFEQMQAQSCRIDRSNKFALLGITVGVVAVILAILL